MYVYICCYAPYLLISDCNKIGKARDENLDYTRKFSCCICVLLFFIF